MESKDSFPFSTEKLGAVKQKLFRKTEYKSSNAFEPEFSTPNEAYYEIIDVIRNSIPESKLAGYFGKNSSEFSLEDYFSPTLIFDLAFKRISAIVQTTKEKRQTRTRSSDSATEDTIQVPKNEVSRQIQEPHVISLRLGASRLSEPKESEKSNESNLVEASPAYVSKTQFVSQEESPNSLNDGQREKPSSAVAEPNTIISIQMPKNPPLSTHNTANTVTSAPTSISKGQKTLSTQIPKNTEQKQPSFESKGKKLNIQQPEEEKGTTERKGGEQILFIAPGIVSTPIDVLKKPIVPRKVESSPKPSKSGITGAAPPRRAVILSTETPLPQKVEPIVSHESKSENSGERNPRKAVLLHVPNNLRTNFNLSDPKVQISIDQSAGSNIGSQAQAPFADNGHNNLQTPVIGKQQS